MQIGVQIMRFSRWECKFDIFLIQGRSANNGHINVVFSYDWGKVGVQIVMFSR